MTSGKEHPPRARGYLELFSQFRFEVGPKKRVQASTCPKHQTKIKHLQSTLPFTTNKILQIYSGNLRHSLKYLPRRPPTSYTSTTAHP
jgi:hypothetical protein